MAAITESQTLLVEWAVTWREDQRQVERSKARMVRQVAELHRQGVSEYDLARLAR